MIKLVKLASNFFRIDINDISFWFSYENCVGLRINEKCYVSKNIWSTITGKHINQIAGEQISRQEFLTYLQSFGNLIVAT